MTAGTGSSKFELMNSLHVSPEAIAAICRKYRIKRLSLFGSGARGELRPDSDIDLLVEYAEDAHPSVGDLSDLRDELVDLFEGRSVDITTPSILRNPYRRRSIERDRQDLYAA